MKKIVVFTIVMVMILSTCSIAMAADARWAGRGSYITSGSLEKPDATSNGRYVWNNPIYLTLDSLDDGREVTIMPVNADGLSMGNSRLFTTSPYDEVPMQLNNTNYKHIHLRISTNSGVYTSGSWEGYYSFRAN